MTRVTLAALDPMPAARDAATAKVNRYFNDIAHSTMQQDAAHTAKRSIANAIAAGGVAPADFAAEAELRGITPAALAAMVLTKPDNVGARELSRQKMMMAIAAATTPAELETILKG